MLTNKERVNRVESMLLCAGYEVEGDPESAVTDALADLMHYCASEDIYFFGCYRSAKMHFECETDEEMVWGYDATEEITPDNIEG